MKKIFFFFIFTIAFCFEAIAMDIPELAKYTLNSTVYIEVEYPYGPNGIGSGIVVNTKRDEGVDILTNYHVIKGAEKVLVKMNHIEWEAQIRGFNKDKDLALLVIMPSVDYPPISFAKTIPQHGDPILVAGAPMGMEQTISTGIVSGLREIGKELAYIQFTAPVSPGSSGGPLVNMNGEVVGMVTMALTQGQNMNFAIAFPILEDFVLSTHVMDLQIHFPKNLMSYHYRIVKVS
jgi:S1-C subfamily serine protease